MIDPAKRDRLLQNWNEVVEDVRQATEQAGREPDAVTIIGVSKYVDAEMTAALVDVGCHHLGENRAQTLWQKADALQFGDSVQWHAIGHLQRNKIRRTLGCRPVIHSVDSRRLLECIAEESAASDTTTSVMIDVNISGDENKTGLLPDAASELLKMLPTDGIEVIGLMAMSGWGTAPDEARRQFAATRVLRDKLSEQCGLPLSELSMGMSGDFCEAIAEGATMVRIGSRLFDGVMERG